MKINDFNTPWDSDYLMESNGFFCGLNMPDALKSQKKQGGDEFMHSLPPYARRTSFMVDEYPACPDEWMRSKGILTSYFVPIQQGKGMWLDFNRNGDNKYDIAIVVSIQGVNAITGLPCKDTHLEQYIQECPKHKKPFGPNRFCDKCSFKWPKQNYLCTTAMPYGKLWIDGFRAASGAVQQYILTEQKMRGVASNIIGEDKVYAIGISFFLSKYPKPVQEQSQNIRESWPFPHKLTSKSWEDLKYPSLGAFERGLNEDDTLLYTSQITTNNTTCETNNAYFNNSSQVSQNSPKIKTKKMEIGAGASIQQQVQADPNPLDYWRNDAEALLCINYCLEEDAKKIIAQGKTCQQGHPKGFLKNVPVGN